MFFLIEKRLRGHPIIKLEFEKDTLDPHIIIGGESINYEWSKRNQLYVKGASNLENKKTHSERKGESEMESKPGLSKNNSQRRDPK